MSKTISFQVDPSRYRHWHVEYSGAIATLTMDVNEQQGLFEGYELKLNSYDLSVDIELADIVQRMRFEHPKVKVVILRSGKEKVFCAGANIRMLGGATHAHKVNFCKFTNETRNTFEAAANDSGQHYIAAIRGACAGGGYELALACNEIYMTDDGSTSVALPEVPLLAVLPGTGGLTRLTDKRKVRRDLSDVFCSLEEGVKGKRAKEWRLVDEVVSNSKFDDFVNERAKAIADRSSAKSAETTNGNSAKAGIALTPIECRMDDDGSLYYSTLDVTVEREKGIVSITIKGPDSAAPESGDALRALGDQCWMLRLARELDDAILHLRFNELALGVWLFRSAGDLDSVVAHEQAVLGLKSSDWFAREILLCWQRVLKRIDLTSRSLIALVENGSCFGGFLAEILFATDRTYMMEGEFDDDERPEAQLLLTAVNFGLFPMSNDLTRLQTRFLGEPERLEAIEQIAGKAISAEVASEHGLITYALDDIDWHDEIRMFLEERTSFSPDAMTGMEANLRFPGPETMETRIFGRLTAWQNWIFQRPNAVGEEGALQRYGTGKRGEFDKRRV